MTVLPGCSIQPRIISTSWYSWDFGLHDVIFFTRILRINNPTNSTWIQYTTDKKQQVKDSTGMFLTIGESWNCERISENGRPETNSHSYTQRLCMQKLKNTKSKHDELKKTCTESLCSQLLRKTEYSTAWLLSWGVPGCNMFPPDLEQIIVLVEARINLTWRYIVGVLDDWILKRCHDVLLCFVMVSDGFLYGFSWCCNWTSPQKKNSGLSQALLPTSTGRDGEIGPSPLYSLEFQLWWQPWTALKCPAHCGTLDLLTAIMKSLL